VGGGLSLDVPHETTC